MTYPVINDTAYTSWPRYYYKCPIPTCGKKCRRIDRHMRLYHMEVREY